MRFHNSAVTIVRAVTDHLSYDSLPRNLDNIGLRSWRGFALQPSVGYEGSYEERDAEKE